MYDIEIPYKNKLLVSKTILCGSSWNIEIKNLNASLTQDIVENINKNKNIVSVLSIFFFLRVF